MILFDFQVIQQFRSPFEKRLIDTLSDVDFSFITLCSEVCVHSASSKLELVLDPVVDECLGDTRADGSLCDSLGDYVNQAGVEGCRDNVVRTKAKALSLVSPGDLIGHGLSGEVSKG